ncbi:hypothetical protein [Actinospica sp.]|uniref:hypothetical protein n=1 Tax=Actinospica sp. TaxID=1872142 RepID=UPI002C5991CF|nr:hypothetical protein [Actinospica sp.]HWG27606.1 hypothetical protein [Actinospica sp.]
MAVEHTRIEILDPDEDSDDIEMLDEPDEERLDGGRGPSNLLPARASRPRVVASLLALALCVTGVGACLTTAYHRHQTDVRIANVLSLQGTKAESAIPGLSALDSETVWHAQPSERVLIPVVNKSPEPVTLLDGILVESGLTRPATLAPTGGATLRPGQTGQLAGNVTADCADDAPTPGGPVGQTSSAAASAESSVTVTLTANSSDDTLLVRARTSGGAIGLQNLQPDVGHQSLQQRICGRQEGNVIGPLSMTTTGDPKTRVISVSLSTTSIADIPLNYTAAASYSADPEAGGIVIAPNPLPTLAPAGTVKPAGGVRVAFSIPVTSCPATPPPSTNNILVYLMFANRGNLVGMETEAIQFDSALADVCG